MGMPTNYSPSLPRVSEIVEWAYPFTPEARERFEDWLWRKDVEVEDYMGEASSWGRYVHKELEKFALTWRSTWKKYRNYVEAGIRWAKDYDVKFVSTETYVRWKNYQGTCDAVVEIEGERWVIDWKSWGLAKDKFGIPQPEKYRKPSDKLKKARLQLSLYGKALKIKKFAVIELSYDGNYHFHPLEKLDDKELNKILKGFENRWVDEE